MECSAGTPLLGVDQTVMTEQKEILYYNEQYIRSDRYKYYVGSKKMKPEVRKRVLPVLRGFKVWRKENGDKGRQNPKAGRNLPAF